MTHPDGIDPNPPEYLQIQEFEAAILAAHVLPPASPSEGHRLRFVCADRRTQPPPKGGLLMSNFGGVGQFAIGHLQRLEVFAPSAGPSEPNGESRLRAAEWRDHLHLPPCAEFVSSWS